MFINYKVNIYDSVIFLVSFRSHWLPGLSSALRVVRVAQRVCLPQKQLLSYLGSIKAVAHWEDRFGWGRGNGKTINWGTLGVAIKTEGISRRLWISKFANGFFGSGRMMLRRKQRLVMHPMKLRNCPRCNAPDETAEHVIRCRDPDAMAKWTRHISDLQPWLIANNTSSHLAKAICTKLLSWHNDPDNCTTVNVNLSTDLLSVFDAQDAIGWLCFLYGFWSLDLIGIQQAYLVSLQSRIIAWDMWDHHNKVHHDTDQGQLVQELKNDITILYQGGHGSIPKNVHSLFRPSLQEVLASSTAKKNVDRSCSLGHCSGFSPTIDLCR